MRIFSENSCRCLSVAVFAFGICSIFIKNRTNSKRLCRRPDHTALLPNMMPAAEAAMAKANAQSNKRFCGYVLRGDPEGSRDVFGRVWVLGMVGYLGKGPDVFGMTRKGLMFLEGAGVGCSR